MKMAKKEGSFKLNIGSSRISAEQISVTPQKKKPCFCSKLEIPIKDIDADGFKIRFATKEDNVYFSNELLNDPDARFHLGSFGYEDDEFELSSYKATFILEDSYERKIGYVSIKAGTLTGFAYIGGFYILPFFRRRGHARRLLRFAENYIRSTWIGGGIDLFTIENEPMDRLLKSEQFFLSSDDKYKNFLNGKYYGEKRWVKLFY